MANGDHVACRGLAHNIALRIGEEHFTVDCYSIPLDCYDMVLEVTWLRTLGPILWDFEDLCMAFNHHGRRVLWKGIGSTRTDIPPMGRLHAARVHTARDTVTAPRVATRRLHRHLRPPVRPTASTSV